jgi:hypothetical protein
MIVDVRQHVPCMGQKQLSSCTSLVGKTSASIILFYCSPSCDPLELTLNPSSDSAMLTNAISSSEFKSTLAATASTVTNIGTYASRPRDKYKAKCKAIVGL